MMVNILLTDEESFHGIKIPKVRAWYMNKDGSYLATDTLKKLPIYKGIATCLSSEKYKAAKHFKIRV
jgi:hypothetical protein